MNSIDQRSGPNVQPDLPDSPDQSSTAPPESPAQPVVHPLDGSQFHNVIDEQIYAELPPTAEEQRPLSRRPQNASQQPPRPDDPAISVGPT
jgi:hypothetical protein